VGEERGPEKKKFINRVEAKKRRPTKQGFEVLGRKKKKGSFLRGRSVGMDGKSARKKKKL